MIFTLHGQKMRLVFQHGVCTVKPFKGREWTHVRVEIFHGGEGHKWKAHPHWEGVSVTRHIYDPPDRRVARKAALTKLLRLRMPFPAQRADRAVVWRAFFGEREAYHGQVVDIERRWPECGP